MQFFSIKNKIFFIFLSVISISILVVGYLGYSSAKKSYINNALEISKNRTESLAKTIAEQSSIIPSDLTYFSNFYALQKYFIWKSIGEENKEKSLEDKFSAALLDFMKKRKLYQEISVLDLNGKELLAYKYDNYFDRTLKINKNKLKNRKNDDLYKKSISLNHNEFFISNLELSKKNDKFVKPYKSILNFTTPIVDKNGEKHGFLIASIYADKFIKLISKSDASRGVNFYLIEKNGEYLYHKNKNKHWSRELNKTSNFKKDFPNVLENANKEVFIQNEKIFSFVKLYPYTKNENNYFYLVSKIDSEYALKDLNKFATNFFVMIIVVLLIGYFIISHNILKMTKPLIAVSSKLKSLAKGELVSYEIEYESNDEIKELIRSSNILVKSLSKTINQAKAISEGNFSQSFKPKSKEDELGIAISNMTNRLNEIANLASMISNGNYDVEINVKNKDDILGIALNNMVNYLNEITQIVESVSSGDLDVSYCVKNSEDKLGLAINNMSEYLKTISSHATSLSRDDFSAYIQPKSKEDDLGNSLVLMTKKLKKNFEKNRDDIWFSEGINNFTLNVKNFDNLEILCQSSISALSRYINASTSIVYLYDKNEKSLYYKASYSFDKDENFKEKIKLGNGVLGQVALDKKEILLSNLDELRVNTALISKGINETFCLPIVYEGELYAVIEISTMGIFTELHKKFILKICEIFASMFHRSSLNIKVKELLEDSQKAYEELQTNTEELQATNDQMQEQATMLEKQAVDLTKQNIKLEKAQIEIDKRAKELTKSNEYKSEFLANMSHELRTPLNSIILLSSLLQKNNDEHLNQKDIEKLNVINQSGNELLRLINDILDLSKIEANKMSLIVDKIETDEFINRNSEAFSYFAHNSGIEFIVKDNFKGAFYNDANRLSQVLRNLLSNAFKFTKEGFVSLEISNSDKLDYGIKIEVKDSGIGISKEKQAQIFKAFVQADGSTSREFGGTGLGLSISKELVSLMKGKIQLESIPFEGSVFTIYLPSLIDDFKPKEEKDFKDIKLLENIESNNFLIIEDDIDFVNILKDSILDHGSNVFCAYTANEGIKIANEEKIDGIIIDIGLPDMDGIEVIKILQKNSKTKKIPIQIISGVNKDDVSLSECCNIIDILQKPVSIGEINRVIENFQNKIEEKIKSVLLIDDDILHQQATGEYLKRSAKVNIDYASGVKEAKDYLFKNSYNLVIVDLKLKDGKGKDICSYIKDKDLDTSIIIYTSKNLSEKEADYLKTVCDEIIIKNFNSHERFKDEVKRFLNKSPIKKDEVKISKSTLEFSSQNLKNKKVLIVDDDIKNIFVLSTTLQEQGMQSIHAKNGKEALNVLDKTDDIDIVLMDIMMPIMNGYEAIKEIRKSPINSKLPIIAVTAKAMQEDKDKAIASGADDYLTKPIDLDRLISMVSMWLNKN